MFDLTVLVVADGFAIRYLTILNGKLVLGLDNTVVFAFLLNYSGLVKRSFSQGIFAVFESKFPIGFTLVFPGLAAFVGDNEVSAFELVFACDVKLCNFNVSGSVSIANLDSAVVEYDFALLAEGLAARNNFAVLDRDRKSVV